LAAILIFNQFNILLSPEVFSEIEVDHFKDDKDLTVNLSLRIPKYPCAILSLDKLDQVHTHTVDVAENLKKVRLDSEGNDIEDYVNNPALNYVQRVAIAKKQIDEKEGCALRGTFTIKLVPGNFHLSFHNYFPEFQQIMASTQYRPDLSHAIDWLYFGDYNEDEMIQITSQFGLEGLHTLKSTDHLGLTEKLGFPHGVEHKISIVPSKFLQPDGTTTEIYQFTANSRYFKQTNNVAITFAFDLENLRMVYHKRYGSFTHFCIQSVAILGGLYMFVFMVKSFIEDGVLDMIYKRRIGKLE
jgi:hypothetical protein